MNKILAILVALLVCLPSAALADVLADGWQDASLDELLSAQQDIGNRISELRAAEAANVDIVELAGSGTSIISEVVIPFAPARITINGSGTFKLSGDTDTTFTAKGYQQDSLTNTGTYQLLVEAEGDWTFMAEPITAGGTLPLSGTGPFVSNYIELPQAMIVTISGDPGTMESSLSNFIVHLNHEYENLDLWGYDALCNELFVPSTETFAADIILQPVDGRTEYFLSVACDPGVEWSIVPKN